MLLNFLAEYEKVFVLLCDENKKRGQKFRAGEE